MRIGIDARDFVRGRVTGIARLLRLFLHEVLGSDSPHELILFGNADTVLDDFPAAQRRILPRRPTVWQDQISLPRLIRQLGIRVFFSPYEKAPAYPSCPVVISIHDMTEYRVRRGHTVGYGLWRQASKHRAQFMAHRARFIVTVSQFSKQDIVSGFGVPARKVRVVPNCVGPQFQPSHSPEQLAAVRARCGLPEGYVLYVGNFYPHKNVAALVAAFRQLPGELRRRHPLVLAGSSDPYRPRLVRLVEQGGLGKQVIFTGYIAEADLPLVYAGATAFCLPSLYEGFGLPLVEAMACGVPVVCSDRTALPEVAGPAALIVSPEDVSVLSQALGRVLTDSGLRAQLRRDGLERARLFTTKRYADRLLSVLEEAGSIR